MFFDSWSDLLRVLVVGTAAYACLVLTLRLSGKRTLAKLNAFDLVVTVALGSTLATVLLSSDVSLAEGAVGIVVLIVLQLVVAWSSTRWPSVRRLAKSEPTLLVRDGEMLTDRLVSHRITAGEVRQALRSSGIGGLDAVAAVVLETDGTISVIPHGDMASGNALADVDVPGRLGPASERSSG